MFHQSITLESPPVMEQLRRRRAGPALPVHFCYVERVPLGAAVDRVLVADQPRLTRTRLAWAVSSSTRPLDSGQVVVRGVGAAIMADSVPASSVPYSRMVVSPIERTSLGPGTGTPLVACDKS